MNSVESHFDGLSGPTDKELSWLIEEPPLTEEDDAGLSPDPARQYLREIGRVPLLTAREEISLARTIERPRYLSPILLDVAYADGDITPFGAQNTIDILNNEAVRARRHMTEANLRLVVSIAKKHLGKGMAFLDLVQEGNIGLMHAVDKFDYHKGYRFSTYATWWIRQGVTRAIADQARTVRLPVHIVEAANKVHGAYGRLEQRGQDPTVEKIAGETLLPEDKVALVLKATLWPVSLDDPLGNDPHMTRAEQIEDPSSSVSAAAAQNVLKKDIEDFLMALTSRERLVIEMRFGLNGGTSHTLEEVGRGLGVTRERIRQIEAKALRKLKHPSRSRKLRGYLDET